MRFALVMAVFGLTGAFAVVGAAQQPNCVVDPHTNTATCGEQQTPPAGAVVRAPVVAPAVQPATQAQTAPAAQALPVTGADIAGLVVLGAFLLAVGAVLVTTGRRHQEQASVN